MSSTIAHNLFSPQPQSAATTGNLFSRWLAAIEAAQQRRANAIVKGHFAHLSDERLAELGFTPEQIKELRVYPWAGQDWF